MLEDKALNQLHHTYFINKIYELIYYKNYFLKDNDQINQLYVNFLSNTDNQSSKIDNIILSKNN